MDGPVKPGHDDEAQAGRDGFKGEGLTIPVWVVVRSGSGLLPPAFAGAAMTKDVRGMGRPGMFRVLSHVSVSGAIAGRLVDRVF